MIRVVRLDDRLVHGQTINNWCTGEGITEILLINENVANDYLRRTIIEISIPEGIKIIFADLNKALEIYEEEEQYEELLIIFGEVLDVLRFIQRGGKIKSLNVGGICYKEGREKYKNCIYLNEEEVEILKEIQNRGVELEVRILPTDKKVPLFK